MKVISGTAKVTARPVYICAKCSAPGIGHEIEIGVIFNDPKDILSNIEAWPAPVSCRPVGWKYYAGHSKVDFLCEGCAI